jgi:hypothetical protein
MPWITRSGGAGRSLSGSVHEVCTRRSLTHTQLASMLADTRDNHVLSDADLGALLEGLKTDALSALMETVDAAPKMAPASSQEHDQMTDG